MIEHHSLAYLLYFQSTTQRRRLPVWDADRAPTLHKIRAFVAWRLATRGGSTMLNAAKGTAQKLNVGHSDRQKRLLELLYAFFANACAG